MSLGYSLVATLDAKYEFDTIKFLLEKGQALGCTYYTFNEDMDHYFDIKPLFSSIETANYLFYKKDNEYDSSHCITVKVDTTVFNLHILNDTKILIMFNCLVNKWSKKFLFQEEPDIDIQRYSKLMLGFIEDFKIINFKVR